jgi:signal transduction histidine kinase
VSEELERATLDEARLRELIDVGRVLTAERDLETVLQRVIEAARELTGARYAALGVLDEEGRELERFITVGIDAAKRAEIGDLPRGRGVLGLLISKPEPLRLDSVGEHPRSYGFPPGHPPMDSFLGVPILVRGEVFGNLYLTEKKQPPFDDQDESAAITLAGWAGIAINNARLYGGLESRNDELRRLIDQLEATTEVTRAVGGVTDLGTILETIVKRARALVSARSLMILLARGRQAEVVASAGEVDASVRGTLVPLEGSVLDDVIRSGAPERIAIVKGRLRLSIDHLGVAAEAALLVPLLFRGRCLGLIAAFDSLEAGCEFDDEDERVMAAFAAASATAVATAQSVAEQGLRRRIDASEQERARWARELHDETLQSLGAIRVLLDSAAGQDEEARGRGLARASAQLEEEIGKLNSLITELRPAALDQLGLGSGIEELARRASSAFGIEVRCEVNLDDERGEETARLDPDIETAAYRLVQEAVNNAGKHAGSTTIRIRVIETDDALEIEVQDDGSGFDPTAEHEGFGLVGMRERVELVAGSIAIDSESGVGTTLIARLPVRRGGRAGVEFREAG